MLPQGFDNVGARFLKLIDSCFPPFHSLAKILNTVKMGYRCMPNMGQAISTHNIKVAKVKQHPILVCNCRGVGSAKLKVVYQATGTREDNGKEETYTGLTSR